MKGIFLAILLAKGLSASAQLPTKEYKLISKTQRADLNHRALKSLNKKQTAEALRAAFDPVRGKGTVYLFIATYPGESFRGGVMDFHDILVVKTDAQQQVLEAYQYTLEWAEMPRQVDLYHGGRQAVTIRNGLLITELRLRRVLNVEGIEPNLEDRGILRL